MTLCCAAAAAARRARRGAAVPRWEARDEAAQSVSEDIGHPRVSVGRRSRRAVRARSGWLWCGPTDVDDVMRR